MIDSFLKIIDQIILLIKGRQLRRKALFDELVTPIYRDLEPIANDYIEYFDFIVNWLQNNRYNQLELLSITRERSKQFLVMRRKIQAAVRVISENVDDEEIVDFAKNVRSFFFLDSLYIRVCPYRYSEDWITEHGFYRFTDYSRIQSNITIYSNARREIEKKWQAVVASYTTIQAEIVSST